MSYISLYRKWRPRTFDEVRGQEAVVTTLKNQVKSDRTGHAYIFIGTRGTGKTSVAKIMAAALNCEDLKDGNPCCKCPSCKSIISGESMDVREIDAASNTGVDNVRELREDVQYPPASGKKKIYIIDEVHMLSTGAFNALLKTLEEPPEYAVFLLATTETAKIPLTIFSRCQRYDFHRISADEIKRQIRDLAEKEGLDIEEKACIYLAKKADGAMRDALSLLDRCASYSMGETITYDSVLNAIGAVDTDIFSKLFYCVIDTDTAGCIKCIDDVVSSGGVISTFITDFIAYLRNLLLLSAAGDQDVSEVIENTSENVAKMKKEAALTDADTLSMYIRSLSGLLSDLRYTNQQRTITEVAFIRLTRPAVSDNEPEAAAQKRIQALEKQLGEVMERLENVKAECITVGKNIPEDQEKDAYGEETKQTDIPKKDAETPERSKFSANMTTYDELSESMKNVVSFWGTVVKEFDTPKLVEGTLRHCKLLVKDGQTLEIMVESQTYFDNLKADSGNGRSNIEELRDFISVMFGEMNIPVELTLIEKGELGKIQGINELVKMPVLPDERKDDV